ncbi:VOC family protein [Blastococcus saxobsidens]|uniref:Putative glyoxalase superfamily protein PhnB n=1 Tax=Blastococcus saxobsidens TaxID=138336 RepID=A0A4Q7Y9P2_9ACTN|nr:VOC family protein [Blastococcus saxobsidens]RZU33750.1 putative glyoxalase superfamily protein PhnB [Blastococcus saxobsidens]
MTTTSRETTTPRTAPAPRVWPAFRCRDARTEIRFLVDVLGFEETAVHGEGDRVDHAQLDWPEGGGVMLGSVREDPDDAWPAVPGTAACYVVTADPAAVRDRAVAAGAATVRELITTDYGSQEFSVRDPEGNLWSFGTYPGEPRRTG